MDRLRFVLTILLFFLAVSCQYAPVNGGDEGTRTPGFRLAKAALSQLSYIPKLILRWAFQDSNLRPRPYQRRALTS
jgi:hypothetical protein